MHIRRRELLALLVTGLTGCFTEETPLATSTSLARDGDTFPSTSETLDARRQTPIEESTSAQTATTQPVVTTSTPPVTKIEVIGREGWGAQPAEVGVVGHTIERLTIHHTGVELRENRLAPARLRAHQKFHQTDRGWPDLAYHFAIDRAGNIYEGRSPEFAGDTATSYDPTGHLLVVLEGNFDIEGTSEPQLLSLAILLAWGAGFYSVGVDAIKSHRDYAETTCPGENLYVLLQAGDIVDSVMSVLDDGPIELRYLRGPEAVDRVADIESA